jgi:hypothetical protein
MSFLKLFPLWMLLQCSWFNARISCAWLAAIALNRPSIDYLGCGGWIESDRQRLRIITCSETELQSTQLYNQSSQHMQTIVMIIRSGEYGISTCTGGHAPDSLS